MTKGTITNLRNQATLRCGKPEDEVTHVKCNPLESPCLFNVREDPCERNNLATARPMILTSLENELIKFKKTQMEPQNVPEDLNADPRKWNNTWVPWQDCEEVQTKHLNDWPLSPTGIAVLSTLCILFLAVVMILIALSVKTKVKKVNSSSEIFTIDESLDGASSVVQVQMENTIEKPGSFESTEKARQFSGMTVPKSID